MVKFDKGFAPNPFCDFCTLACCKPGIRKIAKEGDWVIGTGSVDNVGTKKLIYAMEVKEVLSFKDYARDSRFVKKIPRPGLIEERGDNIYFKINDQKWRQRIPSYHSYPDRENDEKKELDLGGKNVLISNNFYYFGRDAVRIKEDFINEGVLKKGPGYKYKEFSKVFIKKVIKWINSLGAQGIRGDPFDFKKRLNFTNAKC